MKKLIIILCLSFLLTSCANNQFKNDLQANKVLKQMWSGLFVEDFNDTKAIDILVITDRKTTNSNFSCEENNFDVVSGGVLNFGICRVNVPKNHDTGDIVFTKDQRQSSDNYFKILETRHIDNKGIIALLKNSKRTPIIFVHGFNVGFEEAVLRVSQIVYDLKYQGSAVLFTWPAGAKDSFFASAMLHKIYEQNLANAKNSVVLFNNFLTELQKNDIQVNLMVHSMGHQVVLPALKQLADSNPDRRVVNELILNAPDFDAKAFKDLTQDIKKVSNRITLYCSYNDKTMIASRNFNNNKRLGACTFTPDLDSINVSLIDDQDFLGHSYYSSRVILTDVFQTLLGIEADKRLFIRKSEANSLEKYFLRR